MPSDPHSGDPAPSTDAPAAAAPSIDAPAESAQSAALADAAPTGLREAKKARTRASLARAALQLVAEEGLHGTTVEAIAARADVSPRTFFNYFDSKDEAVVHLGADRFRRLMMRMFDAPADASDSAAGSATGAAAGSATRADADVVVVDPILRICDAMLGFLREAEADPDTAADDDLVLAALARDPSLFGTLHASMTAVTAEFETALAAHYTSDLDRDRARVGLSVAVGLAQTAMQSLRSGRSDTPVADQVTHYFELLATAFNSPTSSNPAPSSPEPSNPAPSSSQPSSASPRSAAPITERSRP